MTEEAMLMFPQPWKPRTNTTLGKKSSPSRALTSEIKSNGLLTIAERGRDCRTKYDVPFLKPVPINKKMIASIGQLEPRMAELTPLTKRNTSYDGDYSVLVTGNPINLHKRSRSAPNIESMFSSKQRIYRRTRSDEDLERADVISSYTCDKRYCYMPYTRDDSNNTKFLEINITPISYNNNSRSDVDHTPTKAVIRKSNKHPTKYAGAKDVLNPIKPKYSTLCASGGNVSTNACNSSDLTTISKQRASLNQSNSTRPGVAPPENKLGYRRFQSANTKEPLAPTKTYVNRRYPNTGENAGYKPPAKYKFDPKSTQPTDNSLMQNVVLNLSSKPGPSHWQTSKSIKPAHNTTLDSYPLVLPPALQLKTPKPKTQSNKPVPVDPPLSPLDALVIGRDRSDSGRTKASDVAKIQEMAEVSLEKVSSLMLGDVMKKLSDTYNPMGKVSVEVIPIDVPDLTKEELDGKKGILTKSPKPVKQKKVSFKPKLVSTTNSLELCVQSKEHLDEPEVIESMMDEGKSFLGDETIVKKDEDDFTEPDGVFKIRQVPLSAGSPERTMILEKFMHDGLLIEHTSQEEYDKTRQDDDTFPIPRDSILDLVSPVKKHEARIIISHDSVTKLRKMGFGSESRDKKSMLQKDDVEMHPVNVRSVQSNLGTRQLKLITSNLSITQLNLHERSEKTSSLKLASDKEQQYSEEDSELGKELSNQISNVSDDKGIFPSSKSSDTGTVDVSDDVTIDGPIGRGRGGSKSRKGAKRKKLKVKHYMTPIKPAAPFPLPAPEGYVDPDRPVMKMKEMEKKKMVKKKMYWKPDAALIHSNVKEEEHKPSKDVENNTINTDVEGVERIPLTSSQNDDTDAYMKHLNEMESLIRQNDRSKGTYGGDSKESGQIHTNTKSDIDSLVSGQSIESMTFDQLYHGAVDIGNKKQSHAGDVEDLTTPLISLATVSEHAPVSEKVPITRLTFNSGLPKRPHSTTHRKKSMLDSAILKQGTSQQHPHVVSQQHANDVPEQTILDQVHVLQFVLTCDEIHQHELRQIQNQRAHLSYSRRKLPKETFTRPPQSKVSFANLNRRKSLNSNASCTEAAEGDLSASSSISGNKAAQSLIEVQGTHCHLEQTSKVVL